LDERGEGVQITLDRRRDRPRRQVFRCPVDWDDGTFIGFFVVEQPVM
jgi:hypothetical protein